MSEMALKKEYYTRETWDGWKAEDVYNDMLKLKSFKFTLSSKKYSLKKKKKNPKSVRLDRTNYRSRSAVNPTQLGNEIQ